MAEVFKRPSLTGIEVLWRWTFWTVVLWKPGHPIFDGIMQAVNAFQAGGFPAFARAVGVSLQEAKLWFAAHVGSVTLALVFWIVMSTIGRRVLLGRVHSALRAPWMSTLILNSLRWCSWALAVALWLSGALFFLSHFVTVPQTAGADAEWIPFCATAIAGTLVLFVLWLSSSWVFSLLSIEAAQGTTLRQSIRSAFQFGPLRSKLVEINLVMGIVKIALIVLAMVFSACPLPFENVETQQFLVLWTAGVLLVYFVASDYFHVVRLVAFLRMTEVFRGLPKNSAALQGELAS